VSWNYRVTRRPDPSSESGYWYEVREVHYRGEIPWAHGSACIGAETLEGVSDVLEMIELDMKKPVLRLSATGFFVRARRKS
jgi:hypothetical protein